MAVDKIVVVPILTNDMEANEKRYKSLGPTLTVIPIGNAAWKIQQKPTSAISVVVTSYWSATG